MSDSNLKGSLNVTTTVLYPLPDPFDIIDTTFKVKTTTMLFPLPNPFDIPHVTSKSEDNNYTMSSH